MQKEQSMGQSLFSLANLNRFSTCRFFNNGALRGLLADSLASIKGLTATALTGNFRISLIFLEVMTGCHSDYSPIRINRSCSFSSMSFGFLLPF